MPVTGSSGGVGEDDIDACGPRFAGLCENSHHNPTGHTRHTRHTVRHPTNPQVTALRGDLAEALAQDAALYFRDKADFESTVERLLTDPGLATELSDHARARHDAACRRPDIADRCESVSLAGRETTDDRAGPAAHGGTNGQTAPTEQ